ncbi:MAG: sel1 repeat family protein [Legionella sp.]|nr:MAG: sel1 repeat family protein [Legionella sp.]
MNEKFESNDDSVNANSGIESNVLRYLNVLQEVLDPDERLKALPTSVTTLDLSMLISLYDEEPEVVPARALNTSPDTHYSAVNNPTLFGSSVRSVVDEWDQKLIARYEREIARGSSEAMVALAKMHQNGRTGIVNFPAAIDLLEQAISLESKEAMLARANMHRVGAGGPIDNGAANTLIQRARDNEVNESDVFDELYRP